ncbi:four helix bundle protein [Candidatus Kuenenbacteria bacterium]|nr:four helix bundle protein [Candidatus Kuenenbacteria bacterium]
MSSFTDQLKCKMDNYAHLVFKICKGFPKDELYNTTSQLKRASLSVVLNFIEGFARQKIAVKRNFWEISYGSLKESKYLLYFSFKEGFLSETDYQLAANIAEEIGAMLWRCLTPLKDRDE